MHSDSREAWTCPYCLEQLHVIKGRDHAKDHAPHCPALLPLEGQADGATQPPK